MRSLSYRLRRASVPRDAVNTGQFGPLDGMEHPSYYTAPERHFVPKTGAELTTPAVVHVDLEGPSGEASGSREVLDPLQTIAR